MPLFEDIALSLSLELRAEELDDAQPARLVIALDRSGSMSGAPLREAQHAINELYTRVLAERALAANTLLTFDDRAERCKLDPVDAAACAAVVNSVNIRGGTSFYAALSALQDEIQEAPEGSAFFVAFFTDGQVYDAFSAFFDCFCFFGSSTEHRFGRFQGKALALHHASRRHLSAAVLLCHV